MYSTETETAQATNGTEVIITVQHVDIDPEMARIIFDQGIEIGDWDWKHKVWHCNTVLQLAETQAAARFFYGWGEGSEKMTGNPTDRYTYEAWYAC